MLFARNLIWQFVDEGKQDSLLCQNLNICTWNVAYMVGNTNIYLYQFTYTISYKCYKVIYIIDLYFNVSL